MKSSNLEIANLTFGQLELAEARLREIEKEVLNPKHNFYVSWNDTEILRDLSGNFLCDDAIEEAQVAIRAVIHRFLANSVDGLRAELLSMGVEIDR